MRISIPEFCVVTLIGTSGSGKSTFCNKHFLPTEVLSSDTYRGYVSDDEDSLDATKTAFEALHFMLAKRLERGRLTVVDATNVQKESRKPLHRLAEQYHALKVAIVLNVPEAVCHERNALRTNRQFGPNVVRNQHSVLRRSLGALKGERYHKLYILRQDEIDRVEIVRERIWSRRPEEHGPFDIIGDVHGCREEMFELLNELGYSLDPLSHPEGRKLVFLGDLGDRGPDSLGVLKFVVANEKAGRLIMVPGNHDMNLRKALAGQKVSLNHGLAETLEQVQAEGKEFCDELGEWLRGLVSHAVMDDGKLCVAHAGMREDMQGRGSAAVRDFALYGETTGELDEFGLPVRYPWANDYRGKAMVVYGHTPIPTPEWINNTLNIDTGCVFGGRLTALRYPERELVSVEAKQMYCEPRRPLQTNVSALSGQQTNDRLLDIQDVVGRRAVDTRLGGRVTIREENAIAALEVMSRFAADPRWLIYLPPTMSPAATSDRDGFLEYPTEAFSGFSSVGVETVVCQEKHMGSRAVVVACRDAEVARRRFGIETGEAGIIYTRTGRRFFEDLAVEQELVGRVAKAAGASGLLEELETDWLLLDAELMPWSAKAIGLLRDQYAPVGAAANASAEFLANIASQVQARGVEGAELWNAVPGRVDSARRFRDAYRRYCWTVNSLEDYKIAPFHLLASEGKTHPDRDHVWHMETLARLAAADPGVLRATPYRVVNLASETEILEACAWWEALVSAGGEGMVVKPLSFITFENGQLRQPAMKCRGPEYLRIIYGPEYLQEGNLTRLRQRGLTRKRSLAAREFSLGVEALERFTRGEPLRKVHECVFGVLALESEPVDPRL